MSLETAQYLHQLNIANPGGADKVKDGDDHIRLLKAVLKNTFPGLTGPLDPSVTHEFLNSLKARQTPAGLISLWFGSTASIPTGWALCDGSAVNKLDGSGPMTTPDLRGRVAIGVSSTYALGDKIGENSRTITSEVGGAHGHTATTAEAGAHSHAVTATTDSKPTGASVSVTTRKVDDGGSASGIVNGVTFQDASHSHAVTATSASAGAHSHPVTVADAAGHTHAATVDVRQPSLALHYIIKL